VASVWALSVGIVTLWLDGPIEDRAPVIRSAVATAPRVTDHP
jgi:hypothetical protein